MVAVGSGTKEKVFHYYKQSLHLFCVEQNTLVEAIIRLKHLFCAENV